MSALDRLTARITAFPTWNAMLKCLSENYVPTISNTTAGWKLARVVNAHGFAVYIGGRIIPGVRQSA